MNTYEACCWNLKTQTLFFFLTKVNYFRLAEYSGVWLCVIYMQWEVEYLFHIIQTVTARDWGMWTLATTRSHCDNRVVPVSVILDITYDSANDNLITKLLFAKKKKKSFKTLQEMLRPCLQNSYCKILFSLNIAHECQFTSASVILDDQSLKILFWKHFH